MESNKLGFSGGAWDSRRQFSCFTSGQLTKATRTRKATPFSANKETDLICRLQIYTRSAKTNSEGHGSTEGWGSQLRSRQWEASPSTARWEQPHQVPAKTLPEGTWGAQEGSERAELRKQVERKIIRGGKATLRSPGKTGSWIQLNESHRNRNQSKKHNRSEMERVKNDPGKIQQIQQKTKEC